MNHGSTVGLQRRCLLPGYAMTPAALSRTSELHEHCRPPPGRQSDDPALLPLEAT